MRVTGRFPDKKQVGFLVDALRNSGFDRKDMIIADLADTKEQRPDDPDEVADEIAFLKTEKEGLWEAGPFADGVRGLGNPAGRGVIVTVETTKHKAQTVKTIMEQMGAVEIVED